MEGWRRRPVGRRDRRWHACQSLQIGTGHSDGRRQGYPTAGSSPRGHGVSPGESWRFWFSPGWAKEEPGVIEVTRNTSPGVLTGIDSVFYQNAYPVTAVVYGLYPIRDPDPANLAPLRDGDLNCVAQTVVEHFEGALRGQGLTPARRRKLQDWEWRVRQTGASIDAVAELEKILKRAIILSDIAGGKHGRGGHRPIELICHNGHAWTKDSHFPQSREVHIYEGNVWHAIQEVTQGEPLVVCLLGGQDRQLSVDQFMLQDGRTNRTWEAHERLKMICAKLGSPELAERAFGESHMASIMAKERNGWKPNPANLTAASGTRWVMTRGKSLLSTWRPAIWHPFRVWVKPNPISSRLGIRLTAWPAWQLMALSPKTQAQAAEVQEWEFEATCRPVIPAWFGRHFSEGGWAPDTASCLPDSLACWGLSESGRRSSPWRIRLRSGCPRAGTSLLCHRQIHPGQQGRWKKANEEASDRPRRARLPCPGHSPLGHFDRRCTQKGIAASVSPATTRQPWGHHEKWLPQPSGVTRAIASTCRWNTQPTSPSLTTSVLKRTSLPAPVRATTIPWPDISELPKRRRGQRQNQASDRALPYQKPPRLHPDHSPGQRDAGQGRPGPDLSQFLPLEWPNGLDARKDGTEIRSCDHLGRGLHSAPPHSGNLPRLAWGSGRPVPRGAKGTSWLPRVGTLCGGLEAIWSHLDLEAEGSRPGPEAAVRAPWGVFPGHLRASAIPPHSAAEHHGHHPGALAGWQARPAGARPERHRWGALGICPRGPRRQVGPGLGYAITVHSGQGLTVAEPRKVWIIDDYLQWSNLSYLAVLRVECMHQLKRVVCPLEEGFEGARTLTEQQLRGVIQRKLVAYKR